MSVIDDAFKTASAGLDFKKLVDRFRGSYVRRRAAFLAAANSTWDAPKIAAQIKAEMPVIKAYLDSKNAITNNADTATLPHFDLKDKAKAIAQSAGNGSPDPKVSDTVLKELLTNRADAAAQIVWRALAIQSGQLWKTIGPPPQLQQAALDELLDRRLRMLEQMHCNVNSAGFGGGERPWKASSATGPWEDGFVVRSFEYPSARPGTAFEPFKSQLQSEWTFHTSGSKTTRIEFTPPGNTLPVRVPASVKDSWRVDASLVWINYRPTARAPSDVIKAIFTPNGDFWKRCWMFCDQVGSLVNLDGLWFALRRRLGSDTDFDTVMNKAGYVKLGPVVDQHDRDQLMADDQDPYFENVDLPFDDLQVGDFVRFWNSRMYTALPPYVGAWTSEFSLVMRIDPDGKTGDVLKPVSGGPQIWLAGHGVHTMLYNAMATETTDTLKSRMADARALVVNQTSSAVDDNGHKYVQWSPYEAFDAPGAWWVEIPKPLWHDRWNYATQADALAGIPRTVAQETGGTGYHLPPSSEALYFPLFEPAVPQTGADGDSWRAYLRLRKANALFKPASKKLRELAVDGRLAQGLFYRGSKGKVPVVRPRVRP